jgi:hypothetical protein
MMRAALIGSRLGENTVATETVSINGSEYHGSPEPLTNVTMTLPPGTGGSRNGFAVCEPATIKATGLQGCLPDSFAGPESSIAMRLTFGSEIVPEEGTVRAVFGAGNAIYFAVDGHNPASVEFLMSATYTVGSNSSGPVLNVTVPLVETVPGGPHTSITSLTLSIGASRREGSLETDSVTIPPECPPGGEDWSSSYTFEDGTSGEAAYKSPCPQIAAPLLGQRQTVLATAGEVTVRLAGTSLFIPLTGTSTIPDGSEVNASDGHLLITAATDMPLQTESAEAFGGSFLMHQDRSQAKVQLALSSPLTGCAAVVAPRTRGDARGRRASHHSASKSRQLWVSDNGGNWGTKGRYVSTTVEGTRWLTRDECSRSVVEVAAGRVRVRDLIRHRTRTITAGETYTATRQSPSSRGGSRR